MIPLEDRFRRGFGHSVVRALCLVCLLLVVAHCAHDAVHLEEGVGLVCVAFAVGGAIVRFGSGPVRGPLRVVVDVRVPRDELKAAAPKPAVRGSPACISPLRL
jgi:hypothetical protein